MHGAYERGIELFNRQQFFESHEELEIVWTPLRGPRRLFLQSLIHFAVGFYHVQKENPTGAERQLRKGLKKLAAYLPECEGIDTARLYREGLVCLEKILGGETLESFPVIGGDQSFSRSPCQRSNQ